VLLLQTLGGPAGGGLLLVAGFQTRIVAAVLALFSLATARGRSA